MVYKIWVIVHSWSPSRTATAPDGGNLTLPDSIGNTECRSAGVHSAPGKFAPSSRSAKCLHEHEKCLNSRMDVEVMHCITCCLITYDIALYCIVLSCSCSCWFKDHKSHPKQQGWLPLFDEPQLCLMHIVSFLISLKDQSCTHYELMNATSVLFCLLPECPQQVEPGGNRPRLNTLKAFVLLGERGPFREARGARKQVPSDF